MAFIYRPRFKADGITHQVEARLAATVNAELGHCLVAVAGYYTAPAVANAATGSAPIIVIEPADNTTGADGGAACIGERHGSFAFLNSGADPCAQANVGTPVYAEGVNTVGTNSASGPRIGILEEFAPSDNLNVNRPCIVRLDE